jgi:hypothetical protein
MSATEKTTLENVMTDNHPITVPAGSITGWKLLYCKYQGHLSETEYIVLKSAQWASDMELEACCEWLEQNQGRWEIPMALRAARRPKPPSLKEQALAVLDDCANCLDGAHENTIRRALEALPND